MPHKLITAAAIAPLLAAAGCGAVNATPQDRAISLNVIESEDSVQIEVIAESAVTQQIEIKAELTGSSNSRHNSSTSVASGNRQVLSRMKVSTGETWCAKVEVTEASGANYTLTAGDCGLI